MSLRVPRVSQLFESVAAETPSSVRDRARELSGKFLDARSALPLAPGDIAGNYEVLDVLGAGGQAVVYRAKHRQIGRHVALKVPRREVGDRLLREAQLAARLEHPSIVRVEDIQLEGPVPFMVLELCERGSLDDLLDQHPQGLELEQARSIAASILGALAFAHGEGVIHRDVKPANILFDKAGNAKVADFGIGTLAAAADGLSVSVELSQLSLLAGTPLYVAPEQENPLLRVSGRLDGRADLFSFGKVLFQMLTGASPRTIRPPSRVRKNVHAGWDDFVFSLVEERPEDRIASAATALEKLPTALPTITITPGTIAPGSILPIPPVSAPQASAALGGSGHPVAKPVVVVAPRAESTPRPAPVESAWQKQARVSCQLFAGFYMVGVWFAVAAQLVSWNTFLANVYAGAFLAAAGFCVAEGRRASRAKNPTTGGILAACVGAGLLFVGSAAGVHLAFEFGRHEPALSLTLFVTLPIQALGAFLALIGHQELAPLDELAPTQRELRLVEALLAALDAILVGLTALVLHEATNPTAMVPVLVTLSLIVTAAFLAVARTRWKLGARWF